MNRIITLILVALVIFTTLFFIANNYFSSNDLPKDEAIEDPLVSIYVVKMDVKKSQFLSQGIIMTRELKQSELKGFNYIEAERNKLSPKAIFRKDISSGTYLSKDMISTPKDSDYMYLSLKKDELPYLYEATGIGVVQSFDLNPGDKVSFVSTTSSKSNLIESGYRDFGHLVSKIIISNARILQVVKGEGEDDAGDVENKEYSLVIALKLQDVLKLEMAQKIGDVNIIPSEVNKRFLSIRSSDILENQFGVRELRGTN
ncbi:pilus assembly protein CpaB [Vibrio sp. TRT 21S02]|uniref:pilus assembly protein CpaB n=1 Tax=Vibrio sp. TRT 21S02 TaxID=3418507 RepID=UPI003CF09E48